MMRGTFVIRDGKLVPKASARPLFPRGPHSDLACPMVISDAMPPTQSMADGRIYESKSGMEAATRAAGCRTLGNDKPPPREWAKPDRAAIKDTVERATARFERGERAARA